MDYVKLGGTSIQVSRLRDRQLEDVLKEFSAFPASKVEALWKEVCKKYGKPKKIVSKSSKKEDKKKDKD
jgi:hypothetical protein